MISPIPIIPSEMRKFGLVMAAMLALISGVPLWKGNWTLAYWFWGVAVLMFLLPGLLYPMALKPIFRVWMKVGFVLGWFNQRLILSLLYFLVFTPISLIQKIIGRDPLERKLDSSIKSYWEERSQKPYNPKHFERQF